MWSKNSKLSVEAEIWFIDYSEYVKFDDCVHFFCFRLFPLGILMLTDNLLSVYSQRPVIFLVLNKSSYNSYGKSYFKEILCF